jgi:signal peptidase I
MTGDYVFTAKYAYGYSRVSASPIPLPFISGRIPGGQPRRGDVIVFKNRLDGGKDYIKRVVGLPGDRVQMIGGVLHINGEPAVREPLGVFAGVDEEGRPVEIHRFRETLPGGKTHITQHYEYADGSSVGMDDTYEYQVPEGGYFVMGDNRDASVDSRWIGRVGKVPLEDIVGRAQFVLLSFGDDFRITDPRTWLDLRGDRTLRVIACGE